jgi:hypothetical protein
MEELQPSSIPNSDSIPPATDHIQAFMNCLASLQNVAERLTLLSEHSISKCEHEYRRAEQLYAYRRCHLWHKGDIPHLIALNVSPTARRRMERLSAKGRPVVRRPTQVWDALTALTSPILTLGDSDTRRLSEKRRSSGAHGESTTPRRFIVASMLWRRPPGSQTPPATLSGS